MSDIPNLCDQAVVHAPAETKINLSILATALVDALGGPPEFHQRFSFPLVTTFQANTNFAASYGALKPGTWTDDTSMALCLARSLATHGFHEARQLQAYADWYQMGELSAIDQCFDIGSTILTALEIYISSESYQIALDRVQNQLSGSYNAGNGSLMRVLPVGLAYWRDPVAAKAYARRSSSTTHPTSLCLEACEIWTGAITTIMQQATSAKASPYSKLDLLQYISDFPYENEVLRKALTFPAETPFFTVADTASREAYYKRYHPILRLISKTKDPSQGTSTDFPFAIPSARDLPSSGYVLHTLVAALYCFFATDTFEAGAIMAVNLGDDADTVGAVYAGLAGCWYAASDEEGPEAGPSHLFWSKKVREWKASLVRRDLVEQIAGELAQYQNGLL